MRRKRTFPAFLALFLAGVPYVTAQDTWERINPTGEVPTARKGHSMETIGNTVYLYGGYSALKFDVSGAMYNFAGQEWEEARSQNTPPPARYAQKTVIRDGNMYVYYGRDKNAPLNDIWEFNPSTKLWRKIEPEGAVKPVARYDHSATLIGDKAYIFGGRGAGDTPLNDLWTYDFINNVWEQLPSLAATTLYGHVGVTDGTNLFIYNGYDNQYISMDIYQFNPATSAWSEHSPQLSGTPLAFPCVVQLDPNTVFLFTGMWGDLGKGDCFKWDLNTHEMTSILTGPKYGCAAAAWMPGQRSMKTGGTEYEQFVFFGGVNDNVFSNQTWIYTSDVELFSGIGDHEQSTIRVYPNPADDFITIEISEQEAMGSGIDYQICTILGKVLVEGKITAAQTRVNIGELASGLLFIRIMDNNGKRVMFKGVKQ